MGEVLMFFWISSKICSCPEVSSSGAVEPVIVVNSEYLAVRKVEYGYEELA